MDRTDGSQKTMDPIPVRAPIMLLRKTGGGYNRACRQSYVNRAYVHVRGGAFVAW